MGRAWYQSGVLPAEREERMSDWKAGWLVAASWSAEEGSAVKRTCKTEACTLIWMLDAI